MSWFSKLHINYSEMKIVFWFPWSIIIIIIIIVFSSNYQLSATSCHSLTIVDLPIKAVSMSIQFQNIRVYCWTFARHLQPLRFQRINYLFLFWSLYNSAIDGRGMRIIHWCLAPVAEWNNTTMSRKIVRIGKMKTQNFWKRFRVDGA